jgi:hypothetical protein
VLFAILSILLFKISICLLGCNHGILAPLSVKFHEATEEQRMLSYCLNLSIYRCPQCLARITGPKFDEHLVVCPGCGCTMIVSARHMSLAAFLVVLASYACSFLLVYWLTHDVRRFMLPALECAFLLLVLSARFLLPLLPRNVKPSAAPHRLNDNRRGHAA